MSMFYLSHTWQIKDITPTQKLVLISLADQANDDGVCWPSVHTICLRTSLKERTVRKLIKELQDGGFLKIRSRQGTSNVYDLTPALNAPLHNMHPLKKNTPAPDAPPPLHDVHTPPAPDAPRTQIEPKEEPKGNPKVNPQPLAPAANAPDADEKKNVVEAEIVDNEKTGLAAKPKIEIPDDMPGPRDENAKTYRPWANYAFAFRKRYGTWPVWNQRTAAQISQLVDRLGHDEAPRVAAYYLSVNDARLINEQHSVGLLLARAESLRTQWITGRQTNMETARQIEKTQANVNAMQQLREESGENNEFIV